MSDEPIYRNGMTARKIPDEHMRLIVEDWVKLKILYDAQLVKTAAAEARAEAAEAEVKRLVEDMDEARKWLSEGIEAALAQQPDAKEQETK